ncbi:hypothetical protein EUX98_g9269 [Antrodiella citrinella]|uniref:Ubiquitin-like protease family profile domain-containing protein n=1 Tax=Antrodiella citrinella TaxID=2447956 RepID=A0A4S4LXM2_9APHY|nr:hypothetical protein EUX98_g9269 [Antrodiella citrinella]
MDVDTVNTSSHVRLDIDEPDFNPSDWIGKGKPFPPYNERPHYLDAAYDAAFSVPPTTLNSILPHPCATVGHLTTTWTGPKTVFSIVSTRAALWFSSDPPFSSTIDSSTISTLAARPLPPQAILAKLRQLAGQQWFDGKQSIRDPRYNGGLERFPLYVLGIWEKLAETVAVQASWRKARCWLEERVLAAEHDPDMEKCAVLKKTAAEIVPNLGWDIRIRSKLVVASVLVLSRFLGAGPSAEQQGWMSDDTVYLMVEDLQTRLEILQKNGKSPTNISSFAIESHAFVAELLRAARNNNFSKEVRSLGVVHRLSARVEAGTLKNLYFPVFIGSCHWVTVYVDFENESIRYGDSLKMKLREMIPRETMLAAQKWIQACTQKRFRIIGDTVPHKVQDDTSSCGLYAINMIEHGVFGEPLLSPEKTDMYRVQWFTKLVRTYCKCGPERTSTQTSVPGRRLDINGLLNPACSPLASPKVLNVALAATAAVVTPPDEPSPHEFTVDTSSLETAVESMLDTLPLGFPLKSLVNYDSDDDSAPPEPEDQLPELPSSPLPLASVASYPSDTSEAPSSPRALQNPETEYDLSNDWEISAPPPAPRATVDRSSTLTIHSFFGMGGKSKSAIHERNSRQLIKDKEYTGKADKYRKWQERIRKIDPRAEFRGPTDPKSIRCSKCGSTLQAKRPHEVRRFQEHYGGCKDNKDLPTRRVVAMSRFTGGTGGGAISEVKLALEKYGMTFGELSEKKKEVVLDLQTNTRKWITDKERQRVYSTACSKEVQSPTASNSSSDPAPQPCLKCLEVLTSHEFKRALTRELPQPENYKYANHRYRHTHLGELYTKINGLQELVESHESGSPFTRYAAGVTQGKYSDNNVLSGLLQAMVMKQDRESRNVGMQNFTWPPAYDQFLHCLALESPSTYRLLAKHLPARSERSFSILRSKEPSMPLSICPRTFQLVKEHLDAIKYTGPIALSSDDTKLLPAWRFQWSTEKQSWFLIGAIGEPIRVADPESARQVINMQYTHKFSPTVAILAIGEKNIAEDLVVYSEKIIRGLISASVRVASYACDGTETERKVQRLLHKAADRVESHTITSSLGAEFSVTFEIPFFDDCPVVMIQDSKHALKTMRNNTGTGGRLLLIGNHVIHHQHLHALLDDLGCPIYRRDLEKADKQDDNAASRLFSAATLQHIIIHHPSFVGEIIYLFVYGELVDAYQNRTLSHLERFRIISRTLAFTNMWTSFLDKAGHLRSRFCVSREALDICRMLIEGLAALIVVYRQHWSEDDPFPLLPWFHSSESCEHTFAEWRKLIKDFTMLAAFQMTVKSSVKMRQAAALAEAGDPKARAQGYNHTYLDNRGVDLASLSTYPDDSQLQAVLDEATDEADSLITLLGLIPAHLREPTDRFAPPVSLPGISSWFHESELDTRPSDAYNLEDHLDGSDSDDVAGQLHNMLHSGVLEASGRTNKQDDRAMGLASATASLALEDMITVDNWDINPEEEEAALAQERDTVQNAMSSLRLAPLNTADELEKPVGFGSASLTQYDFSHLVELRRQHQTRQAAQGVRTQTTATMPNPEASIRRKLLKGFNEIVKEQQPNAIGTGLERRTRWTTHAENADVSQPESHVSGNVANASAVAKTAARQAITRRKTLFTKAGVPELNAIVEARISTLRGLKTGDFGVVFTPFGVRLGRVLVVYSKGGGKNGRHGAVDSISSIGAGSNIALELLEFVHGRIFRIQKNRAFQTIQFAFIPPLAFLTRIQTLTEDIGGSFVMSDDQDFKIYRSLDKARGAIEQCMKLSRKRGARGGGAASIGAGDVSDNSD